MGGSGIVQQAAKRLQSNASLPNVLMSVEPRAARCFRIVAMPDKDVVQSDGAFQLVERFLIRLATNDVIAGYVRVACVDARTRWHEVVQEVEQFCDKDAVATEREFRSGGVFD